jgi:hypothetical protein
MIGKSGKYKQTHGLFPTTSQPKPSDGLQHPPTITLRCPTAACVVAGRSMFKPDWVGFDPLFTLGQALLYVNKNNYNQKLSKTLSANSCNILQLHPLSNRFYVGPYK